MAKRDYIRDLRLRYVTDLRSTNNDVLKNTFYEVVPESKINNLSSFCLVKSITGIDNSDKNSYDHNVSVLVDIIKYQQSNNLSCIDVDDAADKLMQVYNEDTHPNLVLFKCHTTTLTNNQVMFGQDDKGKFVRRLIRFEHFIEQTNFDGTASPVGDFNSDFNNDFNI